MNGICTFPDCDNPRKLLNGLCGGHEQQRRRGKELTPLKQRIPTGAKCEGPLCDRQSGECGLCNSHAKQRRRGKELSALRSCQPRGGACDFPDCGRMRRYASGLCGSHERQRRKGRFLTPLRKRYPEGAMCTGPDCARPPVTNGLCDTHGIQWRGGKTLTPIRVRPPRAAACRSGLCLNQPVAHGLCNGHWQQERDGKDLTPLREARGRGASLVRDASGRAECNVCREWLPVDAFYSTMVGVTCRCCLLTRQKATRHHITVDRLLELFDAGSEACWSCHVAAEVSLTSSVVGNLQVDHDHNCCPGQESLCGECVTGLLCAGCNTQHGFGGDDALREVNSAIYLVQTRPVDLSILEERVAVLQDVLLAAVAVGAAS